MSRFGRWGRSVLSIPRRPTGPLRVLVIHAHPDPSSFNRALADAAVSSLGAVGHDVTFVDLYAEQFEPRMSEAERRAYESTTPILDEQVQRYADLVKSHDALVFVYPTWWWGMPAMMKGFLERVLVPGVSFVLDPSSNKVVPGLSHIRLIVGISTYGSSRPAMLLFNDGGRRLVMRCVRVLAPRLGCRTTWLGMYSMDRSTPQQRAAFLEKIKTFMRATVAKSGRAR